MRHEGDPLGCVSLADEPHGLFDLLAGIFGHAERLASIRGLEHRGIRIGLSVAMKVEAPDMKSGRTQVIAPGAAIEAMRDR
jgi:hypothetical protein